MSLDRGKRARGEAADGTLEFRRKASQEIAGEQRRVADPFAQRRHLHADLVDPIKRSSRNRPSAISWVKFWCVAQTTRTSTWIGRRPPTRSITWFCRKRSSLTCIGCGTSPISSRNSVPLFADFDLADRLLHRAGKRAFFMPEQFAFKQRVGNGRAAQRYKRAFRARAQRVNRARQKLLSGAAFAQEQDRNIGGRHFLDRAQHRLDFRAAADNALDRRGRSGFRQDGCFRLRARTDCAPG